jgi:hypothetical protein
VAQRTLSGALAEHLANWPLSGFLGARPLKFIGLSGVPPDCPVRQRSNSQLRPTVDCARSQQYKKSEGSLGRQVALDCSVPQEDRRLQRSTASNPNGRLMCGTHRIVKSGVSGAPPDCPVCPSTATARLVVGAINTPQPPPFKPSKHSNFLI